MFEILKSYGVPHKVLQLIVSIYSIYIVSMYTRRLWLVSRVSVTSPDGDTVLFKLLAGILQGDTLAPYRFIIVLDYALRTALDGKEDLSFTLKPRRG